MTDQVDQPLGGHNAHLQLGHVHGRQRWVGVRTIAHIVKAGHRDVTRDVQSSVLLAAFPLVQESKVHHTLTILLVFVVVHLKGGCRAVRADAG
jgi:hypothetical protein